jgi:predicted TIM-barrel fold metal-dependent hydrolase
MNIQTDSTSSGNRLAAPVHGTPASGRRFVVLLLPILLAACTGEPGPLGPTGPQGPAGPAGSAASSPALVIKGAALDVHAHLASQSLTDRLTGGGVPASMGEELVARLDEANVQRAVVLAGGYMGAPVGITDDSNMAPENDFVAAEVAKHRTRLIGFCGINPLFASAVGEIDRCLDLPGMVGVKLHLPGSGIDMTRPTDVAAVAAVFARIAARDAPVLVHVGNAFGLPLDVEGLTNLGGVILAHRGLRLVHAHCAGPRDDQEIEVWLRAGGVSSNSYVEGSACLKFYKDAPLAHRELIVWRFRKWGIDRVFLGSDYLKALPEETPKEALETLGKYPFTQEEIDTILSNDGSAWLGPRGAVQAFSNRR